MEPAAGGSLLSLNDYSGHARDVKAGHPIYSRCVHV